MALHLYDFYLMFLLKETKESRNSAGVASGYGLGSHGSIPGMRKKFLSSVQRPEWFWDSLSFLINV
jgi:hypothetical protein